MKSNIKKPETSTAYSIVASSIPASLVESTQLATMAFVSSVVTMTLNGATSVTRIPASSFVGIAGVYAVSASYIFSGAYSAFAQYKHGTILFSGLCLGMILGVTPILGIYNVAAIAAAQTINAITTRVLNKVYGEEKALNPRENGQDKINGQIWLLSSGFSAMSRIATSALLPATGPITAALGLFSAIVSHNAAERFIMRNIADKSVIKTCVESDNMTKLVLATNAAMLSFSAGNLGLMVANALVETSKFFSHVAWFKQREAVSKTVKTGLSGLGLTEANSTKPKQKIEPLAFDSEKLVGAGNLTRTVMKQRKSPVIFR